MAIHATACKTRIAHSTAAALSALGPGHPMTQLNGPLRTQSVDVHQAAPITPQTINTNGAPLKPESTLGATANSLKTAKSATSPGLSMTRLAIGPPMPSTGANHLRIILTIAPMTKSTNTPGVTNVRQTRTMTAPRSADATTASGLGTSRSQRVGTATALCVDARLKNTRLPCLMILHGAQNVPHLLMTSAAMSIASCALSRGREPTP